MALPMGLDLRLSLVGENERGGSINRVIIVLSVG